MIKKSSYMLLAAYAYFIIHFLTIAVTVGLLNFVEFYFIDSCTATLLTFSVRSR